MMRIWLFLLLIIPFQNILIAGDHYIIEFGAKPDGKTLNTQAIQDAIDFVHREGGGRVIVSAGQFLTGSIHLKSGVDLHLERGSELLGSTEPAHYDKLNRWKALILADNLENISLSGEGEINGQGRQLALNIDSLFYSGELDSAQYNLVEMRPKYYLRPLLIYFFESKNIKVTGITLRNSSCWVQDYNLCEDLVIEDIVVDSDAYWNNDGIDISDCRRVRIVNCQVNSSDDGICLKSHYADANCDSVYISNCTIRSSASALKLGTTSTGGFKNVIIRDIRVYDTYRSAIAIENVDGGQLENVLVENLVATNTGNAIFIRLGKRNKEREPGTLKNITIRNVQVDVAFERPDYAYEVRGPDLPFFHNTFPSSITGIPGHRVEGVTLENIIIKYPGRGNNGLANMPLSGLDRVPEKISEYPEFSMFGELPAWGFYMRHAEGIAFKNVDLRIQNNDYRPAMIMDDVHNSSFSNLTIGGDNKAYQIVLHNAKEVWLDPRLSFKKL